MQDMSDKSFDTTGARGDSPSRAEVEDAEELESKLDTTGDGLVLDQDLMDATRALLIENVDVEGAGSKTPPPEASDVIVEEVAREDQGPVARQVPQGSSVISTTVTVDLTSLAGLSGEQLARANLTLHSRGTVAGLVRNLCVEGMPPVARRGGAREGQDIVGIPGSGNFGRVQARVGQEGQVSATLQDSGSSLLQLNNPCASGDEKVMGNDDPGNYRLVRINTDDESSEDDDDDVVPMDTARDKGGACKAAKVKTPAQILSQKNKRRRRKDRKQATKAAAKAAAELADGAKNLNVSGSAPPTPPTPGGDRKRASGSSEGAPPKKSKLETTPMARELVRWTGGVYEFAEYFTASESNPIFRHGPIDTATLRSIAHSYSANTQGISEGEAPRGHPTDVLVDAHGLLLLALAGPNLNLVGPVTASRMERSGLQEFPEYSFFSSEVLAYGQRIATGSRFQCTQCQASHFPLPRQKIVFVTGSEVLAGAGLPISLTDASIGKEHISQVAPGQCWDTVWLLGGLRSDPFKVLQSIYGSFHGGLMLLLDLGTLPMVTGESALSVFTRLNELVIKLVQSLRPRLKGYTQVLVLPPVIHLENNALALNQVAMGPFSNLVSSQLIELKRRIDCRNCEIFGRTRTPLQCWSELVSSTFSQSSRDSMHRIIGEVKVKLNPSIKLGDGGVLHLRPEYLHTTVSALVAFVGAHPYATW